MPSVINAAQNNINGEIQTIQQLSEVASKHPYYKFNHAWSRQMQDAVSDYTSRILNTRQADLVQCYSILLCGWLGGFEKGETGKLLTIEEVGGIMKGTLRVSYRGKT